MEDLNFFQDNFGIYTNFILLVFISYKCFTDQLISKEVFYLFLLSCLGPILFHNFDFINAIFPDQGGYLDNIKEYRNSRDYENLRHAETSKHLSIILSLIPIPSVENNYSATFLNKFLLIFFIIYLIKFKYLKNEQAIILLLYPSLFLYSSLMLKETTIIFLLLISYIFLINYKFFYTLLSLYLVFLIKPQLAILFCLVYLLYVIIFFAKIKAVNLFYVTLFLAFLLILEKNLLNHVTNQLNQFIYNFNLEDNNYNQEALNYTKDLIKFDFASIYFLSSNILLFWFKPMFYNASNIAQIIQSFENILIMFVLYYYLNKLYKKNITKAYYIIFSAIFISTPYAIIVSNIGTLARYRFTIIFVLIVILLIEINKTKRNHAK